MSEQAAPKPSPRLFPGGRPWPLGWERSNRIDDGHAHQWQMVIVSMPNGARKEAVTRCAVCFAPRCGDTFDADPCLERRHHRSLHIYESGRFAPVGGVLPTEAA